MEISSKSRNSRIVVGALITILFFAALYFFFFNTDWREDHSKGGDGSDRNWEEHEDTDFAFKFMYPPKWRHTIDTSESTYGLTWQAYASPLEDENYVCGSRISELSVIASISEINKSKYFDWFDANDGQIEFDPETEFKGKSAEHHLFTEKAEDCCTRKEIFEFSNAGYEYIAAVELFVPAEKCEKAETTAEEFFENVWYLDPESTVTTVNFDDTGVLQQSDSGGWVLLYEDQDGNSNTAELVFENASLCDMGDGIGYCDETLLESEVDVIVEGNIDSGELKIARMIKIKF